MLSDTCFQCIEELLEAVVSYEYSDEHKAKLLLIIRKLNEVRDECDDLRAEKDQLKNNKDESRRIAKKMFKNAVKKRDMSSVDFYDGVYAK